MDIIQQTWVVPFLHVNLIQTEVTLTLFHSVTGNAKRIEELLRLQPIICNVARSVDIDKQQQKRCKHRDSVIRHYITNQ